MASAMKILVSDNSRYWESFKHYHECSTRYQCLQDFMDNLLPNILARTLSGKTHLNVIGVGSGNGEVDLKMFSALHLKYPCMTVDNEVLEPSPELLRDYRDLVSQTPGLDYINFNWNNMTAEEFEELWKKKKMTKKADLIVMFQMLYHVKDLDATISFFQSLLTEKGKLLITLLSCDNVSVKMRHAYKNQLYKEERNLTTDNIKTLLDSKGLSYQSYELPSQVEITECFTEGDENGEMLLDFITQVLHFSKSVSPELKAEVKEFLRRSDCRAESDGKVVLKVNHELIVIDQLS